MKAHTFETELNSKGSDKGSSMLDPLSNYHGQPPTKQQNISWNDIKVVQNLIERCLQQYMTQTEIVTALQVQAKIEPGFTCLVWQKLEEQNPDFFFAYNIRLKLKDQIVAFNYLVDQQVQLLQKIKVSSDNLSPSQLMEKEQHSNSPTSLMSSSQNVQDQSNSLYSGPLMSPMKSDLDTGSFFT